MFFGRTERGIEIATERLWEVLSEIVVYFNGDFSVLLILSTLLVLIPIFIVAKKHSTNSSLTIFFYYTLYFYFFSFNISRQMIAVSLVLLACIFLIDNKKFIFAALVIFASGFHLTALTALPLFFLDRIPNKDRFFYIATFVAMFTGLFLTSYLFSLAGSVFGYIKYVEGFELGSVFGNFVYLIILNSFFFFIMYGIKKRDRLFKLFFVFVLVSNLLVRIPFGDRIVLYFAIIQILYLPYFIYNSRVNPRSIVFLIVVLYSYTMFFLKFGAGGILPYVNTLF